MVWLLSNWRALVAAGLFLVGFCSAWNIQGNRLDALQASFDGFIAQTDAIGQAQAQRTKEIIERGNHAKQQADQDYSSALAALRADADRLRAQRSRTSIVPAAPANAVRPDLACFDRPQLEQALRLFDTGAAELIAEGDEAAIGLNAAKRWAQAQ